MKNDEVRMKIEAVAPPCGVTKANRIRRGGYGERGTQDLNAKFAFCRDSINLYL